MNSRAAGESPRRFFRWSAPSSLERSVAYARIWVRDSVSRGRISERRGSAQFIRVEGGMAGWKRIIVCSW
jgi:hypothetical protein